MPVSVKINVDDTWLKSTPGNDAQYTLESFMAMLDRRNSELQQLRMQARL